MVKSSLNWYLLREYFKTNKASSFEGQIELLAKISTAFHESQSIDICSWKAPLNVKQLRSEPGKE